MWFQKMSTFALTCLWARHRIRPDRESGKKGLPARRRTAKLDVDGLNCVERLESRIVLASDFGDAPLPYPTTIAENGAQHIAVGPTLGSYRDSEANGVHSVAADGDDTNGNPDDEEGVTFSTLQVGALNASATVNVQGAATGAKLNAWIDFNGDGSWNGPGEQIAADVTVVNGNNAIHFDVPAWALSGTAVARFRVSTLGKLGPEGPAADGEVEDTLVTLAPPALAANPFSNAQIVSSNAETIYSVVAADLDGDGDMDLVSAERNRVAWYENDGHQQFTPHAISTAVSRAESVFVIDLDLDGDLDVLSASSEDNTIAWFENTGGIVFLSHVISIDAIQPLSVFAADVDGDGDIDVLSASRDNQIIWYPNNGHQEFGAITINSLSYGAAAVFAADVDSDGDMDIVTASSFDNTVAWLENDGDQNFTLRTISSEAAGVFAVFATDVDRDGDIDVISGSPEDNTVAWYENDGSQQFVKRVLSTTSEGVFSIFAADVDGDGDTDILAASAFNNTVAWFENDGARHFSPHTISSSSAEAGSVIAADLDGDGDLDVVAASAADNTIAWFESVNPVSLSISTTAGSESGATVITVTATVETPMNVDRTAGLEVTGHGVTSADYRLSAAVITIPSGQLTGSVTFTIADDTVVEGPETAILALTNLSPGLNFGATVSQSLTITDDDSSNLSIESVGIEEGDNGTRTLTFEVKSSRAVAGGFTVTFNVNDVTTNSQDYVVVTSSPLTFQGGEDEVQTIVVHVIGDIKVETNELLSVVLGAATPIAPDTIREIVSNASALGAIFNDDVPTVSIETIANGQEGTTPVNGLFRVRQSAITTVDTVVNYSVSGTTTPGTGNDYSPLSGSVVIPAGQTTADIPILVLDDVMIEGTETVVVNITSLGSHDEAVNLNADLHMLEAEVTIADDDRPTMTSPTTVNVPENTPTTEIILDVNAIALPATVRYQLSGTDANLFHIDEMTGEITFQTSPDFEMPGDSDSDNHYQVTVIATANVVPAASASQDLTISVLGVNEHSPLIVASATASFVEDSPTSTTVLVVNATDADLPAQALSYSLSGSDAEQFVISSAGEISFKFSPDFEAPADQNRDNVYEITVHVTDHGTPARESFQELTLTILPANDLFPIFAIPTPTFSITENSAFGLVVGTVAATDLDQPQQELTYRITSGNLGGAFAINPDSGQITVADSTVLDFETTSEFNLTITVQDSGTPARTSSTSVTIKLIDLNESPQFSLGGPAVTWINRQPPVAILPQITVSSAVSLGGGILTIHVNEVRSRRGALDVFGTASLNSLGTMTTPALTTGLLTLQIQLKQNVTAAEIQTALRAITFATKGKGLKTQARSMAVTLANSSGQQAQVIQTINVRKK